MVLPAPAPPPRPLKPPNRKWVLSYQGGVYNPALETLNRILSSPGRVILQDPNFLIPRNQLLPIELRDPVVSELGVSPAFGLEGEYGESPYYLVLSMHLTHAERIETDMINTFLRSNLPAIQVPRSARYNLNLDQVFIDWRYDLLAKPDRRVFLNFGVAGATVSFLTMDSLIRVITPTPDPTQNFASIASTEAIGWGLTNRLGAGGEYRLSPRVTLGLSTNYVLGTIVDPKVDRFFASGFPQQPLASPESLRAGVFTPLSSRTPKEEELLQEAAIQTQDVRENPVGGCPTRLDPNRPCNLPLELNGFEVLAMLRIWF